MRLLLPFVLAAGLALPVQSAPPPQAGDSIAYTSTAIWLRAAPSLEAKRLALLPQGSQVGVIECARQSCRVTFRRLTGFVPQEVLEKRLRVDPVDAGRGYVNSRGQWIPSPTHTVDGRAPAGATAHCSDGSYSFSQSRQGTCSWHGGVAGSP